MVGMWGEIRDDERRQALKILRQVEAEHIRDRPWRFLSQGERQRVLIGRALMARPELLILDEPCAGLDPVAREHFVQFLERLARKRGAPTLVLVTHHVEEIMPAFSHVLILKDGAVLAAGPKAKSSLRHACARVPRACAITPPARPLCARSNAKPQRRNLNAGCIVRQRCFGGVCHARAGFESGRRFDKL